MASRRRREHPSIIKGLAWKASGQMLGSSPAQSGELQGKCQGALLSTLALLLTFYLLTLRKGRLVVTPTPHTQSCQEGCLAEDFPEPVAQPNTRRAHGRHMAGTIPGTIMVPEGRFRRVRGASGRGLF